MKQFEEYFKFLKLSEPIIERIETIYQFYEETCPEKITDIFITDYLDKDATRHFENLWFFSESFVMEAKLFLIKDDFDIDILKNNIAKWGVNKENYNFKKATPASRFRLIVNLERAPVFCNFKASGENCDKLKEIFTKFIVSQFSK